LEGEDEEEDDENEVAEEAEREQCIKCAGSVSWFSILLSSASTSTRPCFRLCRKRLTLTFVLDAEIKRLMALNNKLEKDLTQARNKNLESDIVLQNCEVYKQQHTNQKRSIEQARCLKTENDALYDKVVGLEIEVGDLTSKVLKWKEIHRVASSEKDRLKQELEKAE
jgi:hypothetical protein